MLFVRTVRYLDLSINAIGGTIPAGISAMASLQSIDLSQNLFSGTIPVQLGSLTAHRALRLSGQASPGLQVSGTVPDLGSLPNLR